MSGRRQDIDEQLVADQRPLERAGCSVEMPKATSFTNRSSAVRLSRPGPEACFCFLADVDARSGCFAVTCILLALSLLHDLPQHLVDMVEPSLSQRSKVPKPCRGARPRDSGNQIRTPKRMQTM
jgi:hypothetical protein